MITTNELWDDATRLADEAADSELRRRHAIDALYYAIYLSVRKRIGGRRSSTPHGEHAAIILQLQGLGVAERRAGLRLDSLRELRNKAKYAIGLTLTKEEFLGARRHAEGILGLIPTLLDAVNPAH